MKIYTSLHIDARDSSKKENKPRCALIQSMVGIDRT